MPSKCLTLLFYQNNMSFSGKTLFNPSNTEATFAYWLPDHAEQKAALLKGNEL